MSLPAIDKIEAIGRRFGKMFPESEYGDLAGRISAYWSQMLESVWACKPEHIKKKDRIGCGPDPLGKIKQQAVVIAYPDSVYEKGHPTLPVLDKFIKDHFPAVGGLHVLPACRIREDRFNDGYFSQVQRNRVHPRFGTNRQFAALMERYFSMADFVVNHVDMENPVFQAYLAGDDAAGECFYVFSPEEFRKRSERGDFDKIFRPRPFPLFTIFRRRPRDPENARLTSDQRIDRAAGLLSGQGFCRPLVAILSVFNKVANDQMLLEPDYRYVKEFRRHLERIGIDPDAVFTLSETQETRHPPYVFKKSIRSAACLLAAIGYDTDSARAMADAYERIDTWMFGEEIRVLTTFSHVQVDVNTSTLAGLKMLADDFSWYLSMDLNMLRLDAANFAFKKWKTSCFGLPEVKALMSVLYLSMEAVAPRMIANLEVNDTLDAVLEQMSDPAAPPPMIYDFHLAVILPAVFITGNAAIVSRIFDTIARYRIPPGSIRFSIIESHDGKSVRGSMGLLTFSELRQVIGTVTANGGRIKYKSVPARQMDAGEFEEICLAAGLDPAMAQDRLFVEAEGKPRVLFLRPQIRKPADIAAALGLRPQILDESDPLRHLVDKLVHGREPYELCTSTWDAMPRLDDTELACQRYLAFYTLGFALAGRNVKSIYFNDLLGLPNDVARLEQTGELRDIKRTRSEIGDLVRKLADPALVHARIARGMNALIETVNSEPSLAPRGREGRSLASGHPSVAAVSNQCGPHHSITVINARAAAADAQIDTTPLGPLAAMVWKDRFSGRTFTADAGTGIRVRMKPYGRLWLRPCGPRDPESAARRD